MNKTMLGVLSLVLLAAAEPAVAQIGEIDRRLYSEESQYFLVFAAREGLTGHAFVAWATEDHRARMSTESAFGMYARSGVEGIVSVLGFVPGGIADEALRAPGREIDVRLIVQVNSEAYEAAEEVLRRWSGRDYRLVEQDCVRFTSEVAAAIGLRTPSRRLGTLRPMSFVRQLVELNR